MGYRGRRATRAVQSGFKLDGTAFTAAAAGYGVLATSCSRRHPQGKGLAMPGVIAGSVMLGLLLLAVPALLAAFGLLPTS